VSDIEKAALTGDLEKTSDEKGEKMNTSVFAIIVTLISSFLFGALPAYSGQAVKAQPAGSKGFLELECNIADVDLHVCPLDQYERKTIRKFFGLFTSYQESCTGEELFLGTTPLKPIELPEGRYVLLVPPDYVWEHQGQIEVGVAARQKTFFLLKLFKRHRAQENGGPADPGSAPGGSGAGGSGGGGSGTGGAVGSPPP
jgi:uncharacterized membrane protein YgcG